MRNYRKEYDNYHSTPEQIKKRSSRNKANGIKGVKGKDVDHKDGNPMNNSKSNLIVKDKSDNRSFKRNANAGKA
jgi:hypothetical protein|tara:strand:+ start:1795 stop:2016 length:222 start_codon:yes stop_codon:yes gene_type:complete